jgi:phage gp36-like protein
MFLVDADYKSQVKDDVLTTIIENQLAYRTDAELRAEAEITSYLAMRYNVASIFSQTGTARNAYIVMIYIDIALYHLHCRINPGQVPAIRMDRYDAAIKWLDKVSQGDLKPSLPVAATDDVGVNTLATITSGSGTPRDPYY